MMQVRVRPFLSGNSIDSAAGACIEVSGSEPLRATDPEAVGRWLDTLPSTFLLDQEQLAGSVVEGFGTLLQAISEQARLDSTAQVRALRQASSSWLFWLPIDDPQAAQLAADLALLGIQASQEQPPDPVRSARLWSRFEARAWNQTHRHLALAPAAASAALLALGLGGDIATLREAFLTFGHRPAHRAGRFEVLKQHPFELVLTWADGAEAMASVAEYVRRRVQTNPSRRSLLLVSAPDQRSDAYLRAVGASTLGFDQVFCAARSERDARAVEEVPQLLAEGVRSIGSDRPNPLVMADELDAVKPFLKALRPGDLAVVSTFETQAMRQRLHDVGCSLQP